MAIQQDNTLGNLAGILQSIPGLSEAISGGKSTTTSSTSMNPAGMSYLLQQILSSNQGLAAVSSGQNAAGLYNSTVQSQMVNDLLARSAGEVASKDTTTNSTTTKAPTISLGQTLMQGAAGLIGTKLLSKGVDTLGSTVADALGLGATTDAGGVAAGSSLLAGTTGEVGGLSSGITSALAGGLAPTSVANAAIGGAAASEGATVAAGTADAVGAGGGVSGAAAAGAGGALMDAGLAGGLGLAGGATAAATAGGLAAGGATLGGLAGGIAGDVAASTAGIAAAEGVGAGLTGAAAGGGIADALASIGAVLAWVVCTELAVQGEFNHETYQKAAPDFVSRQRLKPSAVRGYHYWAVPYTRIMRRKDWIGRLARAAIRPLAVARANEINGKPSLLGKFTFLVLEPICSFLGKTVARKKQNWEKLYGRD